mmetsp:Transcript_88899/g.275251  ORF Transcript_88899/g.275251 Transcript_88899/m.275251 type:complete len:268 (-) Transcript_88899:53-856(-)
MGGARANTEECRSQRPGLLLEGPSARAAAAPCDNPHGGLQHDLRICGLRLADPVEHLAAVPCHREERLLWRGCVHKAKRDVRQVGRRQARPRRGLATDVHPQEVGGHVRAEVAAVTVGPPGGARGAALAEASAKHALEPQRAPAPRLRVPRPTGGRDGHREAGAHLLTAERGRTRLFTGPIRSHSPQCQLWGLGTMNEAEQGQQQWHAQRRRHALAPLLRDAVQEHGNLGAQGCPNQEERCQADCREEEADALHGKVFQSGVHSPAH